MELKNYNRIVFKVGTSTLTHENGKPNFKKFEELVRVLADLKNSGREVVLVSSGAIAVGADSMKLPQRPTSIAGKQAVAAVGQCELMFIYDKLFSEYNQVVAQVLMTKDSMEKHSERNNVVNTFSKLFQYGAIPVVNENDTVVIDELVFGDNDTLSAVVADCIDADLLVIITDIDGLYDKNPAEHADAKLIHEVNEITEELFKNAGGSGSNRGTGGMYTTVQAAVIAQKAGVDTVILSGANLRKIYDLLDGEQVGTIFRAN